MRSSPLVLLVVLTLLLLSGAVSPRAPTVYTRNAQRFPPAGASNINDIETFLYDVSHPKSPNYGKHWSAGDIVRTFAPTDETIEVVRNWLVASGIEGHRISLGLTKGWMQVNVTVEEAERLMNNVYTHTSGKQHVAREVYHLPSHVQQHIDFVMPSVHFDARLTRRSGDGGWAPAHGIGQPGISTTSPKVAGTVSGIIGELEECDEYITPICLRTLYGLFYEPVSTDKNSFGIVEYSPQAYLQSDLQLFARNYSTDLIGKEPYLVSIDGGYPQTVNQSSLLNSESDLDLQYGMSLVTGDQKVTFYQTGDMIEGASFNNFLDAIDGSYCSFEGGDDPTQDSVYPDTESGGYTGMSILDSLVRLNHENGKVPRLVGLWSTYVITTSYGYDEAQLTPFYTERQCTEYAKLGLMGVTLLFSSGDDGVAGGNQTCLSPNGTEIIGGQIFNPSFPGTCPYITSVGATMVRPNATVFDPEVACTEVIYSGGGFSNYFAIPDYQKDAVDYYLTHYPPNYPPTIWNSTGKSWAYPDISANGANYVVALNSECQLIYGTSCSSPVLGAILTMINDTRLVVNKSTIGFINPTIYSPEFAGAFHDITNGTNPGCGTPGFNATAGWDPVTGLGTPNFPELLLRWLVLP